MAKKKKLTPAQAANLRAAAEKKKKEAEKKATLLTVFAILALVIVVAVIMIVSGRQEDVTHTSGGTGTATTQPAETTQPRPGDGATLDTAVATHYAAIEIENYGTIKLELYGNTAPGTVENFVALAESGFYEGLTFHRIIADFMMQGGAPNASSPAVSSIYGEFASNGFENNLQHQRGVISMARSTVKNSASSQFFIMHVTKPHLDGDYAAFGIVTEGIEIVDAICTDAKPTDGNGSIAEKDRPVIKSVTITYP